MAHNLSNLYMTTQDTGKAVTQADASVFVDKDGKAAFFRVRTEILDSVFHGARRFGVVSGENGVAFFPMPPKMGAAVRTFLGKRGNPIAPFVSLKVELDSTIGRDIPKNMLPKPKDAAKLHHSVGQVSFPTSTEAAVRILTAQERLANGVSEDVALADVLDGDLEYREAVSFSK